MGNSKYLAGLTPEQRKALEKRLHDRQTAGKLWRTTPAGRQAAKVETSVVTSNK